MTKPWIKDSQKYSEDKNPVATKDQNKKCSCLLFPQKVICIMSTYRYTKDLITHKLKKFVVGIFDILCFLVGEDD